MGTLIMYGAMAVAFLAFVAWGNSTLKHHYVDPVDAENKAKTVAYKATIDTQTQTIRTQGASLADTLKRAGECSASVTRLADIAKFQGDAADKLRATAAKDRAAKQATIDRDAATAAGPPTGGTCEQQMQEVRRLGDEYARGVLGLTK